ncbi:hypothetical protein B0I72DRAFT_132091 [Yarrowia lipolytica]|nr:hypothetical protein B0I72DRAFT_132091 [Yarrowia lipolytica]
MTLARALALTALWTYWQLAGLSSMALALPALSVLWRLALIASVDSLALAQAKGSYCRSGLTGFGVRSHSAFGTYCLVGLTGSLLAMWLCSSAALATLRLWHFSSGDQRDSSGSCVALVGTHCPCGSYWL